uniref:Uncharacterized protein n=1 Tax=Leersia perrieri TaxID=77586 RepID=A0A0D9Y009_9ORYZ
MVADARSDSRIPVPLRLAQWATHLEYTECDCRRHQTDSLASRRHLVAITSSMAANNLMRKRTYADFLGHINPIRRFKNFDDVEFANVNRQFSIVVKVDAKLNVIVGPRGTKKYYILMDTTTTIAEPYNPPLRFPLYPKHLTKFDNVFERSNKTFVDIAGIVKYWHPVEQVGGRFYRGSFAGCKNSASVAVAHCRTSFTHCSLWIQKSKPHRSINTLTGLTKLV